MESNASVSGPPPGEADRRVLVVDDDEDLRCQLELVLTDAGFSALSSGSVTSAREELSRGDVAVILTDLQLPDGTGLDVLAHSQHCQPDAVVLMITGNASLESSIKAMALGAAGYLIKPVPLDGLIAHVQEAAGKYRLKCENRRLIAELSYEAGKCRAVCQSLAEGLVLLDAGGAVELFNAAAVRITGLSEADVLGRSGSQVLRLEQADLNAMLEAAARTGQPVILPECAVQANGQRSTLHVSVAPLVECAGKTAGWAVTIADITSEQVARQQVAVTGRMVALGTLAAGVAHEINNPLQIIDGWADLISQGASPEETIDGVRRIRKAVSRCITIVQKLSRVSRPRTAPSQPVALGALVDGALTLIRHELPHRRIELTVRLESGLPLVVADENELYQIVINLVMNARDAMPAGGRLLVELSRQPESLRLRVEDTGTGMDEGTLARIFDPFFTTKGPDKGTGLGLYIVYNLMKQMGGSIDVTSRPGQGTAFTLNFPCNREPPAPAPPRAERGNASSSPRHVLVVDDEEPLRQVLNISLEKAGHKVTLADSGEDALEKLAAPPAVPYDAVVIDLKMPGIGGWEAIRRMRDLGLKLPIIVLTGSLDALPPRPEEAERLAVRILTKPVELWVLRDLVQTMTA